MNFLEMCQRLRQEVGASGTGPHNVEGQDGEYARLVGWIRQSWIDVQMKRADWDFNWAQHEEPIQTIYTEYPLPNDFRELDPNTVRIDGRSIDVFNWREFRNIRERSADSLPIAVSISPAGSIHLDTNPPHNTSMTFEYFRSPQVLVGNTDIPRIPDRFEMIIVYSAMLSYGYYEAAQEVIERGRLNYDQMLYQMERELLPNPSLGGSLA